MAKIKENVTALSAAIVKAGKGSALAEDLRRVAAQATVAGINSNEWRALMTVFADNEDQLKRLRGLDAHVAKPYFKETVAYIAGGSMCTSETTATLPNRISDLIDGDNLNDARDPNFVKLFEIPKIP
ncbi:MAG TPA: hypothetical protein VF591_11605 [Pyrinomonadaceae bacterium]|jgi:hypothetical protein